MYDPQSACNPLWKTNDDILQPKSYSIFLNPTILFGFVFALEEFENIHY
jgi:hypothetical protein